jgi:hypothetical protein
MLARLVQVIIDATGIFAARSYQIEQDLSKLLFFSRYGPHAGNHSDRFGFHKK